MVIMWHFVQAVLLCLFANCISVDYLQIGLLSGRCLAIVGYLFVNGDLCGMQPLISSVALRKEKPSVALQEAVPRMLQAASLGLPCREMCDTITQTCGCGEPTTFGQVALTLPFPHHNPRPFNQTIYFQA